MFCGVWQWPTDVFHCVAIFGSSLFPSFFQWSVGINSSLDPAVLSQFPSTTLFTSLFSIRIGDMIEFCLNEENLNFIYFFLFFFSH